MTPEQVSLLAAWAKAIELANEAKKVVDAEMELRKKVFAAFYPNTKEGINTIDLNGGWKLRGTYKIERKIDEAALDPVLEKLRAMKVNPDTLVKWWPQVQLSGYRTLTAEQQQVFDTALLIKPQAPGLTLLSPKPPKED